MYVLTDTHYVSKRLWEEGDPINNREKGDQIALKCTPEILDSFFDKIIADPDTPHVLITGDLVNNGTKIGHEDFRKALGEAFIEIAQTDEGKEIISVFSQVGYTWGKDSDYDGERDAQAMLKSAGK